MKNFIVRYATHDNYWVRVLAIFVNIIVTVITITLSIAVISLAPKWLQVSVAVTILAFALSMLVALVD